MDAVNKIDNMKNFAELFMAVYSLDSDDHNIIRFSKYFSEVIQRVTNNKKFQEKLDDSLFDEDKNFKIEEFMIELNDSSIKKFPIDSYMYDLRTGEIFTEVEKERSLKISEKYNYDDIMLMTNLVTTVSVIDSSYLENYNTKKHNEEMNSFVRQFFSEYSINMMDLEGRVEFSKYFQKIIEFILNNKDFKNQLNIHYNNLYDIEGNFKIQEFLEEIKICKIRKYWADVWRYDFEKNYIMTEVNDDVIKLILEERTDDLEILMNSIFDEYILSEEQVLRYEKNNK